MYTELFNVNQQIPNVYIGIVYCRENTLANTDLKVVVVKQTIITNMKVNPGLITEHYMVTGDLLETSLGT